MGHTSVGHTSMGHTSKGHTSKGHTSKGHTCRESCCIQHHLGLDIGFDEYTYHDSLQAYARGSWQLNQQQAISQVKSGVLSTITSL